MSAPRSSTTTAARAAGAARPAPARPWLTVVPPLPARAPRGPFVLLVVALLTLGLGALLFLHTALAEDSFDLYDLQAESLALADREQALEQEVAAAAAPQRLAARARALGMVRSENPAFIRTADGVILGVPKPGRLPPQKANPKPGAGSGPAAGAAGAKKPAPKKPTTRGSATKKSGRGATPAPTGSSEPR